jgi:hypothetical protein
MKSKVMLLALALVAGTAPAPRAADPAPPKTVGPKLEVPETVFDYGYTTQASKISHVFWLKNSGTDTLRLTDVRPGCGCTKAPLKKKALSAGDSTGVEVIFSTGVYSGAVRKSSTILMESPGEAPPVLAFTAFPTPTPDSLRPVTFSPPRLNLDSLRDLAKAPVWDCKVSVHNWSDQKLQIRQVSPPLAHIHVDIPKGDIAPGEASSLQITIDPVDADTMIVKSLTFEVSDSSHTRYTLPIVKENRWIQTPAAAH